MLLCACVKTSFAETHREQLWKVLPKETLTETGVNATLTMPILNNLPIFHVYCTLWLMLYKQKTPVVFLSL